MGIYLVNLIEKMNDNDRCSLQRKRSTKKYINKGVTDSMKIEINLEMDVILYVEFV